VYSSQWVWSRRILSMLQTKASRKAEDLQRTYCNVATRGKTDNSHAWHLSKMQLVCWIFLAVQASVKALVATRDCICCTTLTPFGPRVGNLYAVVEFVVANEDPQIQTRISSGGKSARVAASKAQIPISNAHQSTYGRIIAWVRAEPKAGRQLTSQSV